jgi:hypothetical protein
MSEQIKLPRRYRADLVFPPWNGLVPTALPQSTVTAASEGEPR